MLESLDDLWQAMAAARRLLVVFGGALLLAALPDGYLAAACERRMHVRLRDHQPKQWQRIVAGHGSVRGWWALEAWLTDGSVLGFDDLELKSDFRRRGRHLRRAGALAISGSILLVLAYSF